MSSFVTADVFVEDRAHEAFISAMLHRLARELNCSVHLRIRTARGGHPRDFDELALYQQAVLKALGGMSVPDFLVVAMDANCHSYQKAKRTIEDRMEPALKSRFVLACPVPHVELWYLSDLESFCEVVGGHRPRLGASKCQRDFYKDLLAKSVIEAGHPPTLGGIEFARELVEGMDLFRAGKAHGSLKHFIDAATRQLRSLSHRA